MKLLHITVNFEYAEQIVAILDRHEVSNAAWIPMVNGKDTLGKHTGTQVHPGNVTIFQARVDDDRVDRIMDSLSEFRHQKPAHEHLQALVLPVERAL